MNIGRYEVIRELGKGGMAYVYLAHDPYIKRQVAVKLLPEQLTVDPQFRARFQREAEIIATLENSAIVPVYDFGEHENQPFIVMRYMSGGSLSDRMEKGPLPLSEVIPLFERIGSAVDYAHSMGIIHRDMKPGNILFDARGDASLSDFGIAKLAEGSSAFTSTGGMIGTPAYMSPEQAAGEKNLDGRTDIYSLGVVLFEVLSGELPFEADTPLGIAIAHIQEPVPSLLERQPEMPPEFETILRKALDKNPANRFQTASELAQALKTREIRSASKTVFEGPASAGTMIESAVNRTVLEPRYTSPPVSQADTPVMPNIPQPQQPVAKKSSLPRLMGIGGVVAVTLCICIALIGGFASGLIPNPLAIAAPPTEPVIIDLTNEPGPTQFVPVGLNTTYIEYILDASGSMLQPMQDKTRLQIAQEVLTSRLNVLPANAQVGLRVYGHRIPYQGREQESCQDIELVVPIQANGAQAIMGFLPGMQALGMTPMSESIRQAANDFTFDSDHRNFIVLISDGAETCGDEPATVVEYLKEIGIDFAIHVIGLDVDAETASQLKAISNAAGGVYYDARSAEEFDAALNTINESILPTSEQQTASVDDTASPVPAPNAEIASEGKVEASSIYDATFPASLGIDGDPTTSWFSAGPDADGTSTYVWTGVQEDFIATIDLISNRDHEVKEFRTGYGFESAIIQVYNAQDQLVYEETVSLAGTPDPDIHITPNVVGQWIWFVFSGSEAPDCGGFAELKVGVVR